MSRYKTIAGGAPQINVVIIIEWSQLKRKIKGGRCRCTIGDERELGDM